ncbi:type II toxin-antitoxin system VapC family toxin [Novosphingobium sp.]|uniref:type II toxin-antitoxin system VapC family toxin n=1 Tax=Novosphingobium sp. TaxID=1874826 RepID=UPI003BACF214
MTVIDASVAVKWFVEEAASDQARTLLETMQGHLHVPDIFVVEVSSVLVRNANSAKAEQSYYRAALWRMLDLIDRQALLLERTSPGEVADAAGLALDLGHPLKDCIYLALAMKMGCELVTSDRRFAERALGKWSGIRVLEG